MTHVESSMRNRPVLTRALAGNSSPEVRDAVVDAALIGTLIFSIPGVIMEAVRAQAAR